MDSTERMNLQRMISANNVEDCTNEIRNKKHSEQIKQDVNTFISLKHKYQRLSQSNPDQFDKMCSSQCNFLFTNYTDIFNRIKKDELNLNILMNFIHILKKIEDEEIDQHTGAFEVGKILKEMYIDSALVKAEKIDKKTGKKTAPSKPSVVKKISWKDYKEMNNK